jgi:predicted DNA-binding transcriptional regulator AlpA
MKFITKIHKPCNITTKYINPVTNRLAEAAGTPLLAPARDVVPRNAGVNKQMSDDLDSVRVVTRLQAIQASGVSPRTWDRLEANGDTPPKIQLSERRVGYLISDLRKWLERRREVTS